METRIIHITVDTKPMAESIDTVADKVDETKLAVVAMEAAVIAAEQAASENICRNVNFGFYSLIRSQISQKIATHKSRADAKIMEMQQQAMSLSAIQGTMEKDYMMIADRYQKLFEGMNKTLRARIFELDRPVTHFLFNEAVPSVGLSKRIVSEPSTVQRENLTLGQVIGSSNAKYNAVQSILSIGKFLTDAKEQKALIEVVLTPEASWPSPEKKLPFLMVEQVAHADRRLQEQLFMTDRIPAIKTRLGSYLATRVVQLPWRDSDPWERKQVSDHCKDRVDRSDLPQRVKERMVALMEASEWKTMNRS